MPTAISRHPPAPLTLADLLYRVTGTLAVIAVLLVIALPLTWGDRRHRRYAQAHLSHFELVVSSDPGRTEVELARFHTSPTGAMLVTGHMGAPGDGRRIRPFVNGPRPIWDVAVGPVQSWAQRASYGPWKRFGTPEYPDAVAALVPSWAVIAGLLALTVPWIAVRRRRRERARRQSSGRCLRCGYDLAGLTSGRCPECGASAAA